MVRIHYGEGVAIRIVPEPCVGIREGAGEASVREQTAEPLMGATIGCAAGPPVSPGTGAHRVGA